MAASTAGRWTTRAANTQRDRHRAPSRRQLPRRVVAYVPTERISEFVDEPVYGVLKVEPI
jgi:hypothetical protein